VICCQTLSTLQKAACILPRLFLTNVIKQRFNTVE